MNSYLAKAIEDRIKADTGTNGLYQGGSWQTITGAWYYHKGSGAPPYVVFNIRQDEDHTLTSDGCNYTVTFSMFADVSNGGQILQWVWDRLFGDSMLQSNRVPSYGFNRHPLVIPTNPLSATSTTLVFVGSDEVQVEDEAVMGWTLTFRGYWSAPALSP